MRYVTSIRVDERSDLRVGLGHRAAMTLVELLVVITVIVVLIGLLMPAIAVVRNATHKAAATAMIQGLTAACEVYAMEDRQKRMPPAETDDTLRTSLGTGQPLRTLDLLRALGAEWRTEQLGLAGATGRPLIDGWNRTVRYRPDIVMDGTMTKPAPQDDWNAKKQEPYPYIWSLGAPTGKGDTYDQDPARASRWIYKKTTP